MRVLRRQHRQSAVGVWLYGATIMAGGMQHTRQCGLCAARRRHYAFAEKRCHSDECSGQWECRMQSARSAPTTRARRTGSDAKTASRAAVSGDGMQSAPRIAQRAKRRQLATPQCKRNSLQSGSSAEPQPCAARTSLAYVHGTYVPCVLRTLYAECCMLHLTVGRDDRWRGHGDHRRADWLGECRLRENAHKSTQTRARSTGGETAVPVRKSAHRCRRPAARECPAGFRCKQPSGAGYHVARGISCCAGYHAVRDTMPGRLGCALS